MGIPKMEILSLSHKFIFYLLSKTTLRPCGILSQIMLHNPKIQLHTEEVNLPKISSSKSISLWLYSAKQNYNLQNYRNL